MYSIAFLWPKYIFYGVGGGGIVGAVVGGDVPPWFTNSSGRPGGKFFVMTTLPRFWVIQLYSNSIWALTGNLFPPTIVTLPSPVCSL